MSPRTYPAWASHWTCVSALRSCVDGSCGDGCDAAQPARTRGIAQRSNGRRMANGYPICVGSPRVDARPLALAGLAEPRRSDRGQAGQDPAPGVGRVDHGVDLDVRCRVDRLALLVVARDHPVVKRAALGGIGDRLELLAEAEL